VTTAHPGEGLSEVLSRADEAMYQSKSNGRDRVSTLAE
jgi:PleD family two-component response regulator